MKSPNTANSSTPSSSRSRKVMRTISPLRYPGGKACLASSLGALIKANGLVRPIMAEPYAGAAGASLELLFAERVSSILINDLDYRIYSFWWAALNHPEAFIKKIRSVSLSIPEWKRQRTVYRNPRRHKRFDVGFATFYLNRTNRSGILINGGPIGGIEQRGKWRLDARFTRPTLVHRVEQIAARRDRIAISNLDALTFVNNIVKSHADQELFIYLDPPYYEKGAGLYLSRYKHEDHVTVGNALKMCRHPNWVVTYDDVPAIREIYKTCKILPFHLRYTAQDRRQGAELLIAPKKFSLPSTLFKSAWQKTSDSNLKGIPFKVTNLVNNHIN